VPAGFIGEDPTKNKEQAPANRQANTTDMIGGGQYPSPNTRQSEDSKRKPFTGMIG
jgi:hypothetical protein